MREIEGDLFAPPCPVDAICITTNGEFDRFGHAIMGAGVARQARDRWPTLPKVLAARLREFGNRPALLSQYRPKPDGTRGILLDDGSAWLPYHIITLPTKTNWRERSSIDLIRQSLSIVQELARANDFTTVALPRPGCKNGLLYWAEVKPIVEKILPDDRWLVIHPRLTPRVDQE